MPQAEKTTISSDMETHHPRLDVAALSMRDACTGCGICRKECVFLQRYGVPKTIAGNVLLAGGEYLLSAFECSLCGLCGSVCPEHLTPADLFLDMRRQAVSLGLAPLKSHNPLMAYEKRGTSPFFSFYSLPEQGNTVFFPGCGLTGTRPGITLELYDYLRQSDPSTGIVLDCCCKPSHDLGRQTYFSDMLGEMKTYLSENGVNRIIVACPNCFKVFKTYLGGFDIVSIYECLDGEALNIPSDTTFTVHDPCVLRHDPHVHGTVRALATRTGCILSEMPHSGIKTLCCGEGGGAGFVNPELGEAWKSKRMIEADGKHVITYCTGCSNYLKGPSNISHILDIIFDTDKAIAGKSKVSSSPVTYINRLIVKRRIKKDYPGAITRERRFRADDNGRKHGAARGFFIVSLIISAILALKFSGASGYLETETLKAWVERGGVFAPLIYILIYSISPALFLPGLPVTIVGGILFGPFWGVVYAITGATLGACVSFLIARYGARSWAETMLMAHPRLKRLDEDVGRQGWKIVAFTRLIPVFPYNLLNYAFGLTKISFIHYAVTSFFCMLPACIAFIVFSSSLPDILRGHVSPAFVAGGVLIGIVSSIPLIVRKQRAKKS
ncbi:MAG: VTT domain-containing protein [Proteobacteria bacterium]|nr:VTT domain-containing protein [Pseudomonadota bacterium]